MNDVIATVDQQARVVYEHYQQVLKETGLDVSKAACDKRKAAYEAVMEANRAAEFVRLSPEERHLVLYGEYKQVLEETKGDMSARACERRGQAYRAYLATL